MTDSKFEKSIDFWTDELIDSGLRPHDVIPAYRRARERRQKEIELADIRGSIANHYPFSSSEIVAAHRAIQREVAADNYRKGLRSRDCPVCAEITLDPPDVVRKCPYHPKNSVAQLSSVPTA